jgi:CBS domain containing-hemolysin-like protein
MVFCGSTEAYKMPTHRFLAIASETLVGVALLAQILLPILLPTDIGITFSVSSQRMIAIPIRWFLPLLLISVAGALSAAALLKIYWTLVHAPISG